MLLIKNYRELKGLTQIELSEVTKIPNTSLSRYENGTREPDLISLISIAEALDVSVDELLGRNQKEYVFNEDVKILISLYQKLDKEAKEGLIAFLTSVTK